MPVDLLHPADLVESPLIGMLIRKIKQLEERVEQLEIKGGTAEAAGAGDAGAKAARSRQGDGSSCCALAAAAAAAARAAVAIPHVSAHVHTSVPTPHEVKPEVTFITASHSLQGRGLEECRNADAGDCGPRRALHSSIVTEEAGPAAAAASSGQEAASWLLMLRAGRKGHQVRIEDHPNPLLDTSFSLPPRVFALSPWSLGPSTHHDQVCICINTNSRVMNLAIAGLML